VQVDAGFALERGAHVLEDPFWTRHVDALLT
jgi:hypothetical protein